MSRIVKHMVGEVEVVALTDGALEFDNGVFPDTDPALIASLLQAAHKTAIETNFNAFLIRSGQNLLLVDSGPRDLFGPTAGNLLSALTEAGVTPADVTSVFFTHLHPDHIAGAVNPDGGAVFPNAELFVAQDDHVFWTDQSNFTGADDAVKGWQQLAETVLSAYGDRLSLISDEAQIIPNVTMLPLPGHTPGHSGIRVDSGADAFVHTGDIVHAQSLQLANPDISVAFDVDGSQARHHRKRLLDMLATDGTAFSGGHYLHPGIGRVERTGNGYRFVSV
jgi:glyoxylase-like metal-dependent hydrolase (beta-lactamase superfamily II)